MERFGYTLEDLRARRHTPAFVELMRFQARRAAEFYTNARSLLTPQDRQAAIAAEIMRAVYQKLLSKMWWGDFRVFGRRYRLSSPRKLACITAELVRGKLHLPPRAAPRL
jgi:15-cis-phytoene synthase